MGRSGLDAAADIAAAVTASWHDAACGLIRQSSLAAATNAADAADAARVYVKVVCSSSSKRPALPPDRAAANGDAVAYGMRQSAFLLSPPMLLTLLVPLEYADCEIACGSKGLTAALPPPIAPPQVKMMWCVAR